MIQRKLGQLKIECNTVLRLHIPKDMHFLGLLADIDRRALTDVWYLTKIHVNVHRSALSDAATQTDKSIPDEEFNWLVNDLN